MRTRDDFLKLVKQERQHQLDQGWSEDHDDGYTEQELTRYGAFLAFPKNSAYLLGSETMNVLTSIIPTTDKWMWGKRNEGEVTILGASSFVPKYYKNRERQLVVAMTFILAELERLERKNNE